MSELELSFRKAAARSGGLVSHATLNEVALGRHGGKFNDETLRGIALALDVSQSAVWEAAGAPQPATEFRLPRKANRLTAAQRKTVLNMVEMLLDDSGRRD
jgi:hypothetical protein